MSPCHSLDASGRRLARVAPGGRKARQRGLTHRSDRNKKRTYQFESGVKSPLCEASYLTWRTLYPRLCLSNVENGSDSLRVARRVCSPCFRSTFRRSTNTRQAAVGFWPLHEVAGGGGHHGRWAAAALFGAGIAVRTGGKALWCMRRPDLFSPAVSRAGLHPDRVIFCESDGEEQVLSAAEWSSFSGLSAVIAELVRLPMNALHQPQLSEK